MSTFIQRVYRRYRWQILSLLLAIALVGIFLSRGRLFQLRRLIRFVVDERIDMVDELVKEKKERIETTDEEVSDLELRLDIVKRERELIGTSSETHTLTELSKMWKEMGY